MPSENGVFLHSKQLDSEFMIKCLQMLVNNFPEVKITCVESDERHSGYRVLFSSPKEDVVLARKQLIVSGKSVRIVPLRTSLTIHGVPKNGTDEFDRELRKAVRNKFGKLLDFHPVPNPENVMTKNLRACVDVPELEELEVFKHEGYPDMLVYLPRSNETFRVTFHCRRCKNSGHVQQNCRSQTVKEEACSQVSNFSNNSRHSSSFYLDEGDCPGNEDDDTNSNEDIKNVQILKGCSSSCHGTAGPSKRSSAKPLVKSEISVENTSRQLQAHIIIACKEFNIINKDQLYAFFKCVKSKRNPSEVAKNYTSKPKKMKTLFRRIIELCQTTSHAATREDKQFIYWLKKLEERFEGGTVPKISGKGKFTGEFFYAFPNKK